MSELEGGPTGWQQEPSPGGELDKLLGAVARGEHGAFDLVYEQLRGPVYRRARGVLHDQAHAEEVTQEVMLEIWSTAVRYDPAKGSATAWALMIAHRRAVDRVRSAAASSARDRQNSVPPALWEQVSHAADNASDRQRLLRCLEQLSGPQREAITLAYYGGHTYRQVADILGAPVGTVKSRIRDALILLRGCMHGDRPAGGAPGRPSAFS